MVRIISPACTLPFRYVRTFTSGFFPHCRLGKYKDLMLMKSLRTVDRIEIWPIDRLSASVKRSRKHRAQQSTQIAASRLEFGDVHPFWSTRMKPDCWARRDPGSPLIGLPHLPVGPRSRDGSRHTHSDVPTTGLRNMLIAVKSQ